MHQTDKGLQSQLLTVTTACVAHNYFLVKLKQTAVPVNLCITYGSRFNKP